MVDRAPTQARRDLNRTLKYTVPDGEARGCRESLFGVA